VSARGGGGGGGEKRATAERFEEDSVRPATGRSGGRSLAFDGDARGGRDRYRERAHRELGFPRGFLLRRRRGLGVALALAAHVRGALRHPRLAVRALRDPLLPGRGAVLRPVAGLAALEARAGGAFPRGRARGRGRRRGVGHRAGCAGRARRGARISSAREGRSWRGGLKKLPSSATDRRRRRFPSRARRRANREPSISRVLIGSRARAATSGRDRAAFPSPLRHPRHARTKMFAMTSLVGTPVVAAPARATRTVRNTKTMAAGKPNAGKKVRDDARTMHDPGALCFFRPSLAPSAPPRTPRARRIAPPDAGTRTSASERDRRARDRRGCDRVARASTRARRAGVSDKIPRATNEATCQRRQSHTVGLTVSSHRRWARRWCCFSWVEQNNKRRKANQILTLDSPPRSLRPPGREEVLRRVVPQRRRS